MIPRVFVLALLVVWGFPLWGQAATNAPPGLALSATNRARVVIVEQPGAMVAFKPQVEVVRRMLDGGMLHLTGKPTIAEAWRSLVSTQDVVGLKVHSSPGPTSGTRPAVAEALIQGLLAAGLPARQIIVWDRQLGHLRLAGYTELAERYAVRLAGALETGYDTNHCYDTPLIGSLVFGDHEFGQRGEGVGRKSFVSSLVTREITKLINLTPLLNHNQTGVSGCLFSLALGSVDNTVRFINDADRLAVAVPDIYALPVLGDRVVLNIVDALVAQYYGEERSLLHYSAVLDQLRLSTDPVALDVLSIQELERQRQAAGFPAVNANLTLYQNAALVEIGVCEPKHIRIEWVR